MESKDILLDKRLTFGAKGLYLYISEHKPDGDFSQQDLLETSNNGRQEIRRYLDELIYFKYIEKKQLREGGRFTGQLYTFLDNNPNLYKNEIERNRIGFLYLVFNGKEYKIGITTNPKQRFNTLKNQENGIEIIEYAKINNYMKSETFLNDKFDDKRVRGEWFNLNEEDIEFVKNYIKDNEVKI